MLRLNNVNVAYGAVQVLHNVSLEVQEGEIVTLIGANGAGKSTLLKTISGLMRPAPGSEIKFTDLDLTSMSANQIVRTGISHVPEGRRIFPGLTVRENLEVGATVRLKHLRLTKEIESDIEEVYARFPRLKERCNQLGWSLSGGEQQMLAFGRALVSRPRMLLLDEPSLGLAPNLVNEVFDIIKTINKDGTTILLVEQNATMALKIANRGYVIETGKIVKEGSGEQLLNDRSITEAYLGISK